MISEKLISHSSKVKIHTEDTTSIELIIFSGSQTAPPSCCVQSYQTGMASVLGTNAIDRSHFHALINSQRFSLLGTSPWKLNFNDLHFNFKS